MDEAKKLLLHVLRDAIRGENANPSAIPMEMRWELYQLAMEHHVLPLVTDALHVESTDKRKKLGVEEQSKQSVIAQAQRTADFLLLLKDLEQRGLRPLVVKGIVCRNCYPEPELRPSVDEDLLIRPEEYAAYRTALEAAEFQTDDTNDGENYEVSFLHPGSHLCVEIHTSLFPADSEAYGDCALYFEGAIDRAVEIQIEGTSICTLAPTDHLLFLICHAYKHFLHGGVGIRQLCDMALMAEKDGDRIDWPYIRSACDELHIVVFSAAMFRICDKQLGFAMPEVFAAIEVDESDLLEDVLSGGLYGVEDIDRAHSSTMTLEAVSAARSGRKRKGALHSVFLPLDAMRGHFPYLRRYPWLLPVAWAQRICRYLARKSHPDPVSPARSLQIARERIALLAEYKLIDQL